jgi:hypothetical protein
MVEAKSYHEFRPRASRLGAKMRGWPGVPIVYLISAGQLS